MANNDDDLNVWIVFGVALALLAVIAVAYHRSLPPNRQQNKQWLIHLIYWVVAGATFAIPTSVSAYIFSAASVTLIGTAFPIYESVRAICTPDEDDDKYWLQYYLVGGILFISTQCVDEWLEGDGVVYWYQAMFYVYVWLFFPKTDGAALIYTTITEPYISPRVRPLTAKVNNWISFVYQGTVNVVHIALVVLVFMFFPDGLKKVIAVAIGTVYPWLSSITAAATEDVEDDTYWLTYWACYSCLFLIMEFLEIWIGWIPGFYTAYIAATLYLMLPMMQGADKVFRKILVPLAGLQDLLILRDAIQIKKRILAELDPEQAQAVRRAIVKFYDDESNANELDPSMLKRDLLSSWKGVQLPGFKNPFRKKKHDEEKQQELLDTPDAASATLDAEKDPTDSEKQPLAELHEPEPQPSDTSPDV